MKCKECKHFKRSKVGMRGGIKGSCKLKNTNSYRDTRNGNQKACKTYFEPQESEDRE